MTIEPHRDDHARFGPDLSYSNRYCDATKVALLGALVLSAICGGVLFFGLNPNLRMEASRPRPPLNTLGAQIETLGAQIEEHLSQPVVN